MKNKTLIIAEAGVNHNGSLKTAYKLIDIASKAKVDYIKFQTFRTDEILLTDAPMASYQKKAMQNHTGQYEMLKKLELSQDDHLKISKYCQKKNLKFISTPFDKASLEFLDKTLNIDLIKIPSGEITNPFLLIAAGATHKPIILSTGMSTIADIELALGAIAYGIISEKKTPSINLFKSIFISELGQNAISDKVSLLHCTTEYPASFSDVNLLAINSLKSAFCLPVGLSDHTEGVAVSVAAVALGATIIEKHFTLDKNLVGPDHKASLEPQELTSLVDSIRQIEQALGKTKKVPSPSELKNALVARRSIVAKTKINKLELFSKSNISISRPGTGLSPMYYWDLLGKPSDCHYKLGEVIKKI